MPHSCLTSGTYRAYFLIVFTYIPPIPSANRILRITYALCFLLRPTASGRAVKGKRCTKQAEAAGVRTEIKESENVNKEWLRAASLESAMRHEFMWFTCAHIFQGWQSHLQAHYRIHNSNQGKVCLWAICCILVTFGQYPLRKSHIGLILVNEEGNWQLLLTPHYHGSNGSTKETGEKHSITIQCVLENHDLRTYYKSACTTALLEMNKTQLWPSKNTGWNGQGKCLLTIVLMWEKA